LPVVRGSKVIGVVSQRDVYRMQSIDATNPTEILVSEVMTTKPYTVEPDERIDHVAREMVRRKIGTALVTHDDELLGLFTSTDALLAIAALVEDEEVPGESSEVESAARAVKNSKQQRKGPRSKPALVKTASRTGRARPAR
jgi:acetoin utilization protein AcuB